LLLLLPLLLFFLLLFRHLWFKWFAASLQLLLFRRGCTLGLSFCCWRGLLLWHLCPVLLLLLLLLLLLYLLCPRWFSAAWWRFSALSTF
jgi:hypothetical protein